MAKNIIVSNRLPIRISKVENSFKFTATSGGLATGMKSVHEHENSLWVGWPGIGIDEIAPEAWVPLVAVNLKEFFTLDILMGRRFETMMFLAINNF